MIVTEPYESVGLLYRTRNPEEFRGVVTEPYESVGLLYKAVTGLGDPTSHRTLRICRAAVYLIANSKPDELSQNPTNL